MEIRLRQIHPSSAWEVVFEKGGKNVARYLAEHVQMLSSGEGMFCFLIEGIHIMTGGINGQGISENVERKQEGIPEEGYDVQEHRSGGADGSDE